MTDLERVELAILRVVDRIDDKVTAKQALAQVAEELWGMESSSEKDQADALDEKRHGR